MENFSSLYPRGCLVNDRGREKGKARGEGRRVGGLLSTSEGHRTFQTGGARLYCPRGPRFPSWVGGSLQAWVLFGQPAAQSPASGLRPPAPQLPCIHPAWGHTAAHRDRSQGAPHRDRKQILHPLLCPGPLSRDTLASWFKSSLNRCCVPKKSCL